MKLLLVSATVTELEAYCEQYLVEPLKINGQPVLDKKGYIGLLNISNDVDLCFTGVGVVSALTMLLPLPLASYDWVVGVGFVGAYDRALAVGDVVLVAEDAFADYGIFRGGAFCHLNATDSPTLKESSSPFYRASSAILSGYRAVRAHTRAMPTGDCSRVEGLDWKATQAAVESMESAAFAWVCSRFANRYLSLRVVSNYVAPREVAQWNSPLAQMRLAEALNDVLKTIQA